MNNLNNKNNNNKKNNNNNKNNNNKNNNKNMMANFPKAEANAIDVCKIQYCKDESGALLVGNALITCKNKHCKAEEEAFLKKFQPWLKKYMTKMIGSSIPIKINLNSSNNTKTPNTLTPISNTPNPLNPPTMNIGFK